jgi:hypothetical protein
MVENTCNRRNHTEHGSSIDTLSHRVHLQSEFGHFGITQEVKRHPDEMSLDPIKLLSDFLNRHILIVKVSLLVIFILLWIRRKCLVVVKVADCRMLVHNFEL